MPGKTAFAQDFLNQETYVQLGEKIATKLLIDLNEGNISQDAFNKIGGLLSTLCFSLDGVRALNSLQKSIKETKGGNKDDYFKMQ